MSETKTTKPKASVTEEKKTVKATKVKTTETKPVVKEETESVKTPVKKKFIAKAKKVEVKKSNEAWEAQQKIKTKKKHPVFRGRFGKKNIRRKSIAKWDKWRKPHGIDLDRGINHGRRPKIGYGNPVAIKGLHASGYREVMVFNMNDLAKIDSKVQAARISATVGKKKRNDIVAKANDKKIRILN